MQLLGAGDSLYSYIVLSEGVWIYAKIYANYFESYIHNYNIYSVVNHIPTTTLILITHVVCIRLFMTEKKRNASNTHTAHIWRFMDNTKSVILNSKI